jgi:hypothetical protein
MLLRPLGLHERAGGGSCDAAAAICLGQQQQRPACSAKQSRREDDPSAWDPVVECIYPAVAFFRRSSACIGGWVGGWLGRAIKVFAPVWQLLAILVTSFACGISGATQAATIVLVVASHTVSTAQRLQTDTQACSGGYEEATPVW